jgi:hypothetical protein
MMDPGPSSTVALTFDAIGEGVVGKLSGYADARIQSVLAPGTAADNSLPMSEPSVGLEGDINVSHEDT